MQILNAKYIACCKGGVNGGLACEIASALAGCLGRLVLLNLKAGFVLVAKVRNFGLFRESDLGTVWPVLQ